MFNYNFGFFFFFGPFSEDKQPLVSTTKHTKTMSWMDFFFPGFKDYYFDKILSGNFYVLLVV